MESSDGFDTVKTTETTLRIIATLLDMENARIEEISAKLDIAPSTVHRHLQTLRKHDYVVNEGGLYRLGLQFLTVGGRVRKQRAEYRLIEDSLKNLAEETEERVQFEVHEQGERVFLYTEIGERAVHAHGDVGKRGPLHTSAAGKAMLAAMSDQEVESIINDKGLEAKTENTISDIDYLFEELEEIRENGIAFNREETNLGIRAVGASITRPNGGVLGAISVSGPAHRLSGELFNEELPKKIRGTAQEIELNLEYWT